MLMMYIFFVTIGAGADISVMIETGVMIFVYASFIIIAHLIVIVLGAKIFNMDLAEIVIASLACIGGPVAPAAISVSRGWPSLANTGPHGWKFWVMQSQILLGWAWQSY